MTSTCTSMRADGFSCSTTSRSSARPWKTRSPRTPAIVPLWQPYYFNERFELRRLADPHNVFGASNRVVLAVNRAIRNRLPETFVAALRRADLTISDVTDMDLAVNTEGRSAQESARAWVDAHAARVATWFGE
jgi:ABC-type proline/glycine betaine transport system substrate-binding protein